MPLYTIVMKNGNTYQVRADNKEEARKRAIDKARHENIGMDSGSVPFKKRTEPASVRVNK